MKRFVNRLSLAVLIVIIVALVGIGATAALAAARGEWQPNTWYAVGDTVTYQGVTYQCRQAHTSLVGWEPPNVPALWLRQGTATTPPPTTPPPTTPPTTPPPSGNLALNRPVTCSSIEGSGTPCAAAVDGSMSTRWASARSDPQWIRVDLGTTYTINRVVLNWEAAYGRAYQIQVSSNASTWTTIYSTTTGNGATDDLSVAGSGRYVRMYGTARATSWGYSLWEFQVYSGGTPPPTTPPPTTPPPTTPPPTTPPPTTPPPTTQPPPPPGGPKILGYFAEWGVYGRNYHVKNIVTSGSASKLTHINYAFGNVQNGQCTIGDAYADYDRFYDAASSVDGVADTWDAGALRGSFNQLRKLKRMYPNIRILWSFGGWTWSGGFTQAAANPTAFANSCYNLLHDARWNGVFDGIDIDWEYPNECGLGCDSSGPAAFRNLMSALRSRFGSELVTAAVPAGYAKINAADYGGAAQYVNWYNVMTYDFFGPWAATGPTAPHSPLTSYTGIPQANFYSDYAIQLYKQKGVPASKLLLGVGFYGKGWTGVTQSAPGGSATGAAPGTYEPGTEDYKVLVNTCPATGTVAGTAYARCGSNWWSYDTPATLASKMTYKKNQGLGGTFFWELSGDTANGSLITALYNNR